MGKPTFVINNMAQYRPRTEFSAALAQIAAERGISPEVIMETIKTAILAAYRRDARERGLTIEETDEFEIELGFESGEVKIFKLMDGKKEDMTPPGFSRVAAQTAKQVIAQKIREAEKSAIMDEYSKRSGALVSGLILRFDGPNVIVDIGKTEAVIPPIEQVRNENYRSGQRLTFYLIGVQEGLKGPQIIVSRASAELVKELFKREVPEVSSGTVEITRIAREPGVRTKVAVSSNRPGIDPVGSCVGQKGVRVKQIIDELFGEKIDIIQYAPEPVKFVAASLLPAEGLSVEIDEAQKMAKVTVPEDQLSLAIGKEGQNVRLAVKLTGYTIDIVGQEEKKAKKEKKEVKEEEKKEKKITKKSKKEPVTEPEESEPKNP